MFTAFLIIVYIILRYPVATWLEQMDFSLLNYPYIKDSTDGKCVCEYVENKLELLQQVFL